MTDPTDQWWSINGQDILDALSAAHRGDLPDIVYPSDEEPPR